jgi:hypothetical protein
LWCCSLRHVCGNLRLLLYDSQTRTGLANRHGVRSTALLRIALHGPACAPVVVEEQFVISQRLRVPRVVARCPSFRLTRREQAGRFQSGVGQRRRRDWHAGTCCSTQPAKAGNFLTPVLCASPARCTKHQQDASAGTNRSLQRCSSFFRCRSCRWRVNVFRSGATPPPLCISASPFAPACGIIFL